MDEDEILHWLLSHLENDEVRNNNFRLSRKTIENIVLFQIEDIDEDTLDRMVKEGRTMAVLFCKSTRKYFLHFSVDFLFFLLKMTTMIRNQTKF